MNRIAQNNLSPTRRSRRRPRWRASVATLATAFAAAVPATIGLVALGGPASAAVPGPPSGWTTTWSDDFSGAAGSGVDGNWKYDTGQGVFGTGEIETMTNSTSNVYQDGNGHLVIKALHSGSDPNSGWTSGRIETNADSFGAPAGGIVEMVSSIQQPNVNTSNGAGYWPAFWMLGNGLRNGGVWPGIGEVDILEDINGRSSVFGTLHCGTNPGGPCNESTGIGSGEHACSGCQTGYHTYAVQIDRSVSPEQIRWYLDGSEYFSVNANQVDATTWANAVDHPFFIIYDLAMGGGFPNAFGGGPNASTVSGGQMNIDWVAVYNKAPAGGGGGGGATAGATGAISSGIAGKCMDVNGSNTTNGTAVQLYDCNGTNAQNWTQYSDNTLHALGKCLDATSGGTTNGTKLQLWDCNGTGSQVWQPHNGGYQNPQSGRCVDDPSSSTANFTQLQLWDCNGTNAQIWSLPGAATSGGGTGGGGTGGGGGSATSTIQAEAYSSQSGTQTETTTDTGGGQDVGYLSNGDWLAYTGVNFGSTALTQFQARVASGAASGVTGLIEVHLDSLSNPAIGSFSVGNTGGWQTWQTIPANINGTTGTHTVYLKFVTGSGQDFVNLNWFSFS
jgi:beta-glucanase (GH16 family)